MAYEQLGVLFKEGSALLEKRVKSLPDKVAREREVVDGVRGQWVSAKRRGKKCSDLVEQLLERIEEVDLQDQRQEREENLEAEEKLKQLGKEERIVKAEFERPVLKEDDED